MAEEKSYGVEELKKELESERDKIKRLEELLQREELEVAKKEGLLNELYQRIMIEGVTDKEEIARAIGKEQYEALSYHLAKEHEKRVEIEKKLMEDEENLKVDEKKLAEEEEVLQRDGQKIKELEEELTKEHNKRIELEKQLLKDYPQPEARVESEDIFDDFDLKDFESTLEVKPSRPSRSHVTIKDLIKLLLRINRMKAIDVSIMLNTSKENVLRLAKPLVRKGYIEIENSRSNDPTLRALRRLLELKRH